MAKDTGSKWRCAIQMSQATILHVQDAVGCRAGPSGDSKLKGHLVFKGGVDRKTIRWVGHFGRGGGRPQEHRGGTCPGEEPSLAAGHTHC